jgi:hypothetical protein
MFEIGQVLFLLSRLRIGRRGNSGIHRSSPRTEPGALPSAYRTHWRRNRICAIFARAFSGPAFAESRASMAPARRASLCEPATSARPVSVPLTPCRSGRASPLLPIPSSRLAGSRYRLGASSVGARKGGAAGPAGVVRGIRPDMGPRRCRSRRGCVPIGASGASGVRPTCRGAVRRHAAPCGSGFATRCPFAPLCAAVRACPGNRADWI